MKINEIKLAKYKINTQKEPFTILSITNLNEKWEKKFHSH